MSTKSSSGSKLIMSKTPPLTVGERCITWGLDSTSFCSNYKASSKGSFFDISTSNLESGRGKNDCVGFSTECLDFRSISSGILAEKLDSLTTSSDYRQPLLKATHEFLSGSDLIWIIGFCGVVAFDLKIEEGAMEWSATIISSLETFWGTSNPKLSSTYSCWATFYKSRTSFCL
jgi:hypothetical protein